MKNNIFIISLSPAIDYILKFDKLNLNKTNRPIYTDMYPAGKGIHVSMLLNNLNIKNESIIFSNGNLEEYFYSGLDKIGLKYKKFRSEGEIRINLKLIDDYQTECSVKCAEINDEEINKLFIYLKDVVKENDYIIVSGSVPENIDASIYKKICALSNSLNARCIVDSFGPTLNFAIEEKPFLIKPNIDEIAITTKTQIETDNDVIVAARKLLDKGAQNILISMGEKGAIFINKEIAYKSEIGGWNKTLVNSAGAGDSMLGGFISEYIKTNDFEKSLAMSIICGSATAYSDRIASLDLINELSITRNDIKITKI